MDDNFADVYPLGKKLEYMQGLLELRPRTLLPITPLEEERILASMPKSTPPVLEHPIVQSNEPPTAEQQHNPYTHRFRRKLLLRQKKRSIPGMPPPFDLDLSIRQALSETDLRESRLSKYYPQRTISNYVGVLPIQRSIPAPPYMPKFRRKPIVVVDEARIERRKQLTQQRLPELPQTLAKLQHVHQRAHILQTWKAHEDDLAIRNLQALDAQHQGQAKSGANGQHAVVGASSSNEMDVTHDQSHDAPPAEQVEHMDVSVDPTQMEMMPHAKPTAPHMDEASIRRDGMQPHEARPTERISLSSAFASKGGTQVRQERVLAQLRELEKSQSHRSASEVMTSADMERYLAMTMGHVETLVDKDLDPSGKPWSFEEIVFGDIHQKREYSPIVSPWSGRTLKPIIRKDYETTEPRKMALLKEIETRFHMAQPEWIAPPPSPIEYRYLRPFMLRQINKLLCDNFWAGIDVSESLLYPEFSIVAMYKELVIGCAFITTLGYITYIVVHPEWRSSDIGKFMMYHLIQTCHGKDITLHVSCNNPAIRLYQKFCFQPEERIPNFYDKYMPADAMLSRDAFFMRLRR